MCHYNNPGPGLLVCAIATILDLQHGSNVKNVTEEGRRGGKGGKGRGPGSVFYLDVELGP